MKAKSPRRVWVLAGVLIALIIGVAMTQPKFVDRAVAGFRRSYPDDYRLLATWFGGDTESRVPSTLDTLPLVQLHFSDKDVARFDLLRDRYYDGQRGLPYYLQHGRWHTDPGYGLNYYEKNNKWRRAELSYGGERFAIRIKAHGRTPYHHRSGHNISFSVRIENKQIHGATRFNLIVASRRGAHYDETVTLARELDLLVQHDRAVRVRINDGADAAYYLEHRFNDKDMEAAGRPTLRRYRAPKASVVDSRSLVEGARLPALGRALRERLAEEELPPGDVTAIAARYADFNRVLEARDEAAVVDMVDIPYIARFEAMRRLRAFGGHGFLPANFYIFLDTANGKFYPAFTRDNFTRGLMAGDGLEAHINTARWRVGAAHREHPIPLFQTLAQSDVIRAATYQALWPLLANEASTHAEVLRRYLSKADPSVRVARDGDVLELRIAPGSMAPLSLTTLDVSTGEDAVQVDVSDGRRWVARERIPTRDGVGTLGSSLAHLRLMDGLDERLQRQRRVYRVRVRAGVGSEVRRVVLTRGVDGVTFEPAVVRGPPATWNDEPLSLVDRAAAAVARGLTLRGRELRVPRGELLLEEDLRIPVGYKLVLEEGAHVRLSQGVSIVCPSGLDVRGTADAPVVIEPRLPNTRYGTIAVLGDSGVSGGGVMTNIAFARITGGSEAWIEGAFFSGGLSIHHNVRTSITDSVLTQHHGDDALNVKYGEVHIERTEFVESRADQVDLDVCTGTIRSSRFVASAAAGAAGDGLDVSTSDLEIADCVFIGFGDKGISVGERSDVVVRTTRLERNAIGIAVKDQSLAYVLDAALSGNVVDLASYRKKRHFGGGLTMVSPSSQTWSLSIDEHSRVSDITVHSPAVSASERMRGWRAAHWSEIHNR